MRDRAHRAVTYAWIYTYIIYIYMYVSLYIHLHIMYIYNKYVNIVYHLVYRSLNKPKSVLLIKMITCVFEGNLSGRNEFEDWAADNLLHRFRNRKITNSFVLLGKL